jgi:hypothetical protein
MLEYVLEPKELTKDPNDYRARVVNVRTYTQSEIIDRIMGIGAGLTRSDILSVIEAEKQVLAAIIAEGGAVNTELFSASPSIQGVFTPDAEAEPHTVRITCAPVRPCGTPSSALRLRKVTVPPTGTIIEAVTDIKTGSVNGALTPDRDLRVTKSKLKISGNDPDNGVYFVSVGDGTRIKVDPSDIVENNPRTLVVVIPALASSIYHLQIATQYTGGGGSLKTPRLTTFDKPRTVT